jgi:hypothetical protein
MAIAKKPDGWRSAGPQARESITKKLEGWRSPGPGFQPTHAGRE